MKKIKKVVYINTQAWLDLTHKDYLDYLSECMDEEISEEEIDEEEFDSWRMRMSENDTSDFFDNIKFTKFDCPVVVTGVLGLWDGSHDIFPKRFDSRGYNNEYYDKKWRYSDPAIARAIRACIGSGDDFEVTMENGVVNVRSMHHDGTNVFEIRCVSKTGEKPTERLDGTREREVKDRWTKKFSDYLF